MLSGPPRRRRARPVADAPLDELLGQTEDLTKGWLLALLEVAPLDDAPRILATDLTREGPRVCEAALRAIASDSDQRRLEPGGVLAPLAARVGELAGAGGPDATAQAVDALQAVLWSALRAELRDPDPELVSELAERLAQVTGLLRTAALREQPPRPEPSAVGVASGPAEVASGIADVASGIADVAPGPTDVASGTADVASGPENGAAAGPPLRAWVGAEAPTREPTPLWVGALREEIGRTGSAPLTLLLAELEDAERVLAVESEAGTAATFGAFAQGVRRGVRRQDILVSESPSRAWVIARETNRAGAQALAERISAAVREGHAWRGAPLVASVGFAVLGEDGDSPSELIEAAEEARFAASASGQI